MKKKFCNILLSLFACSILLFALLGCEKENNNQQNAGGANTEQGSTGGTEIINAIAFKTLAVEGTKVYGKVGNKTETFSFINEIKISGTAQYVVSLDIYGIQQVATKTIPLYIGDNTVFVTEMIDNQPMNVYEVTIRRRPVYTVIFNTDEGTAVENLEVEEDSFVAQPSKNPSRLGYDFLGWSYDFRVPITRDTTINEMFQEKEEMKNFKFASTDTVCAIWGIKNKNIKEIEIPNYVTVIREEAFKGCQFLETVRFSENSNLEHIERLAFEECTSLTEINIPNSVKKLGGGTFNDCTLLETVVLSSGLTSIEASVFYNCTSLRNVNIPNDILSLGGRAFYNCINLKSIIIPNRVGIPNLHPLKNNGVF